LNDLVATVTKVDSDEFNTGAVQNLAVCFKVLIVAESTCEVKSIWCPSLPCSDNGWLCMRPSGPFINSVIPQLSPWSWRNTSSCPVRHPSVSYIINPKAYFPSEHYFVNVAAGTAFLVSNCCVYSSLAPIQSSMPPARFAAHISQNPALSEESYVDNRNSLAYGAICLAPI
jgi:hypothetical protein